MATIKYPANRDLRELIRFSADNGCIWLAESRMLLLHAAAMAALRRELIQLVGLAHARNLLTRVGYVSGLHDAEIARKIRGSANPVDAFVVGPQLHMLEGIVRVKPVAIEFNVAAGQFYGEFLWEGSWEAESHLRDFGMHDSPVCWMQIGYASGYTSAFMNKFILFKEIECVASGASECRIVGKPLHEWDDADEYRDFFSQESMVCQLLDLQTEVEALRQSLKQQRSVCDMVGESPAFRQAYHLISRAAASQVTVLLLGETGVGKERFARSLHRQSPRANAAFVAVNCAAIPDNLIESELFGVEKGAFTGAAQTRIGRFERADGGTLFLDEIGELPLAAQAKLLRVLQEGEIERLGDERVRKINVRVVAATNVDLQKAVQEGRFRADLYYRVNIYPVVIPPLRERQSDIPALAKTFMEKACVVHGKKVAGLTDKALTALQQYSWPGNIRELENMLERGVILAQAGALIEVEDLFPHPASSECSSLNMAGKLCQESQGLIDTYEQLLASGLSLDDIELAFLHYTVEKAAGNLSQAARLLGITRPQLAYRLKKGNSMHQPY